MKRWLWGRVCSELSFFAPWRKHAKRLVSDPADLPESLPTMQEKLLEGPVQENIQVTPVPADTQEQYPAVFRPHLER